MNSTTLSFFYKQLVQKQPALGWQTSKQLTELNSLSLSNNKNYGLKKSGIFLCDKRKIAAKSTMQQNSTASKIFLGKF